MRKEDFDEDFYEDFDEDPNLSESNDPVFISHPDIGYLYREFERCSSDLGFFDLEKGKRVILKASFLPFSMYAPWDKIEGTVVETSKYNTKVDIVTMMYAGKIWVANWMIEDVLPPSSPNASKQVIKRKVRTPRKSVNKNSKK